MNNTHYRRIGVLANLNKKDVPPLLRTFVAQLVAEEFDIFIRADMAQHLPAESRVSVGVPRDCDIIAAVGGDGTILHVAREFAGGAAPILGVKAGHLGFLTEPLSPTTAHDIKRGAFRTQERMRIEARIVEGGRVIETFGALNDVVIHGAGYSRMVTLRAEVDGRLLREYSADGVILATPTGSTAYSLSAGGPLLAPTVRAIVLTPMCPHTLSDRPIVLQAEASTTVHVVSSAQDIRVTVDGQVGYDLRPDQHVVVEKSPEVTRLLVPNEYDFFGLLREKL